MATRYTTSDGDMVDEIAWKYYGATDSGQVEAILAVNPGLADHGPVLPAGVMIVLPEQAAAAQTVRGVKLWD
ncbi:tail protein X [Burkholderia alba]|uniref:tail protein X n=1 Tax=Burkholderia alba TaxID=2683677 RepID=UPI002B05D852|nr:tail protein X [Burkholderia alba]